MENKITLTEYQLIEKFHAWLTDCDLDELARVAGEVFGGECFCDVIEIDSERPEIVFNFNPDKENYYGAFNDLVNNEDNENE